MVAVLALQEPERKRNNLVGLSAVRTGELGFSKLESSKALLNDDDGTRSTLAFTLNVGTNVGNAATRSVPREPDLADTHVSSNLVIHVQDPRECHSTGATQDHMKGRPCRDTIEL